MHSQSLYRKNRDRKLLNTQEEVSKTLGTDEKYNHYNSQSHLFIKRKTVTLREKILDNKVRHFSIILKKFFFFYILWENVKKKKKILLWEKRTK